MGTTEQLSKMYGDYGLDMLNEVAEIAPEFRQILLDVNISILNRPGLSKRDRELIVIAVMTAKGNSPRQLRAHIMSALQEGVTKEELIEAFIQMGVYAGMPAAFNSVVMLKEILDESK